MRCTLLSSREYANEFNFLVREALRCEFTYSDLASYAVDMALFFCCGRKWQVFRKISSFTTFVLFFCRRQHLCCKEMTRCRALRNIGESRLSVACAQQHGFRRTEKFISDRREVRNDDDPVAAKPRHGVIRERTPQKGPFRQASARRRRRSRAPSRPARSRRR